jgi:hypothetical protein
LQHNKAQQQVQLVEERDASTHKMKSDAAADFTIRMPKAEAEADAIAEKARADPDSLTL